MATKIDTNLVWLDLEMTDLDPIKGKIIEIACIITDKDLNIIAEGEDLVVHVDEKDLKHLDPWVKKKHNQSGLIPESRISNISLSEAEERTLKVIKQFCEPQSAPLCGNSVHVDRLFLYHHMPKLYGYLHHHIIDVDSLNETLMRWGKPSSFDKIRAHRAMGDIYESIRELKYLLSLSISQPK